MSETTDLRSSSRNTPRPLLYATPLAKTMENSFDIKASTFINVKAPDTMFDLKHFQSFKNKIRDILLREESSSESLTSSDESEAQEFEEPPIPQRDKSFLPDLLDKDEESNLTDQSSERSDTEERGNIETPDEQGLSNIITPTQNPTCTQKKNIPYNITHDPDSSSSFIPDAQSTKRWSKNLSEISKPDKSQTYWWDDEPMNKENAHVTFSDPNLHSSNSSLNKSTTSLPAYLGAEPVSNEIVEE
ncbi:hypothetical protein QAD02_014136 [Eretmocerus hayati]|uniref:Uncharacterized protein n=1 Tax=Eretmocerus hayati TaxID=131215 RepID=A0ACC2P6Y6_9HYME|nr:hypothetical protein QAD02_014136 [Eretmocerus hayati]